MDRKRFPQSFAPQEAGQNGLSPEEAPPAPSRFSSSSSGDHEELRKAINQTFYRTIEEVAKLKVEIEQATAHSRLIRSNGSPQVSLQRLSDLKNNMKHLKELAETCLRRIDLTEEQLVKTDKPPAEYHPEPSPPRTSWLRGFTKRLLLLCRLR
jgi:hypothetical protein